MVITNPPSLEDLARVHQKGACLASKPRSQPRAVGSLFCEVDGDPLSTHPRCRRCGILVGPHHLREDLIDGYCERCYLDVRRRRLAGCPKGG